MFQGKSGNRVYVLVSEWLTQIVFWNLTIFFPPQGESLKSPVKLCGRENVHVVACSAEATSESQESNLDGIVKIFHETPNWVMQVQGQLFLRK